MECVYMYVVKIDKSTILPIYLDKYILINKMY